MRVLRGNSVASGSVGKGGGRSNVMNNRFQEDAMHQEGAQDLQQRNEELVLVNERLVVDQRELLRQQRLVVLGKLVATIAHKIGTPLTAISGHLQLLLEDPQLSSEVNQRIQIIFRQTDRLNTVMQDLLNFVRTPTLALESVSIPHCLDQALQLFLPIFDKQSILLSTHYHASLPLACADFLQLQDAVNNLIDNAIDAMPQGGQLRVSAWPQDRQDSVVHEPGICIEIHDTGIGIPSDCLESIFQTFFTTKNIGEGTGLGLAIASEIVQQHQGQLSVEST
ncbi:MAG: ATP-binding protein, partial [Nitrospirota bacterium]|nr:ATP-binding protein [Nitrospirota bacterium]